MSKTDTRSKRPICLFGWLNFSNYPPHLILGDKYWLLDQKVGHDFKTNHNDNFKELKLCVKPRHLETFSVLSEL